MRHEVISTEETAFDRLIAKMATVSPTADCSAVRDAHPDVIEHALTCGLRDALSVVVAMKAIEPRFYHHGKTRRAA
ncbi:hypothetical protein [Sphingobium sp. TCM1]|uniref:hypothetical protein n=1 Tax=Sphingobium sp. TCM1 TaxID=453246 RepID=UPI0007F51D60|nr:hypothetical protein [Sphingobium sp. TCM1]OAN52832.1 hypothetical protein A7Q26_06450 [Sphingobium sp. TCM1]